MCHGELFRLRPHPRYLTGYYLMISAGGALGGVAVTLIAPHVFVTFFEWNFALFLGFVLAAWLILRAIVVGRSKNASGNTGAGSTIGWAAPGWCGSGARADRLWDLRHLPIFSAIE